MRSQKCTFGGMFLTKQCARLCVGQAAAADKAVCFTHMMPPAWQRIHPPLSRSSSRRGCLPLRCTGRTTPQLSDVECAQVT